MHDVSDAFEALKNGLVGKMSENGLGQFEVESNICDHFKPEVLAPIQRM